MATHNLKFTVTTPSTGWCYLNYFKIDGITYQETDSRVTYSGFTLHEAGWLESQTAGHWFNIQFNDDNIEIWGETPSWGGTANVTLDGVAIRTVSYNIGGGTRKVFDLKIIEGSGIASAEAFGTPTMRVPQSVLAPSIAPGETFGTLTVQRGNVTLSAAGNIPSGETAGFPQINLNISVSGVPSAETFGAALLTFAPIQFAGITSAEAFGTATIQPGNVNVEPSGIGSSELIGSPNIRMSISVLGVSSDESFGSPTLNMLLTFVGDINTGEAFGNPIFSYEIESFAIPTAELFGTPLIVLYLSPSGISGAEQFGAPAAAFAVHCAGIPSAESFGTATIQPGNVNVEPSGIGSGEAFGTAKVSYVIYAQSIPSLEIFGNIGIDYILHVSGINSAEVFGNPLLVLKLSTLGIGSGEAFGAHDVEHLLGTSSIASGEAFGTAKLNLTLFVSGIVPGESFGICSVKYGVSAGGIHSLEWFGTPTMILEQYMADVGGIPSTEAFGTAIVFYDQVLDLDTVGIISKESFGSPTLAVIRQNLFFDYVQRDLEQGMLNLREFGEMGIYIFANGETFQLPGIFDNEYRTIDPDTGVGVMSSQPVFWCSTRQFQIKPGPNDRMRIRGINYQVIRHEPDGTGLSMLFLHNGKTV